MPTACSYIRGKPDTGDVDMLILPPESCIQVDSRLALYELLQILRRRVRFLTRPLHGPWPSMPSAYGYLHSGSRLL